jgi:hypothetical protein
MRNAQMSKKLGKRVGVLFEVVLWRDQAQQHWQWSAKVAARTRGLHDIDEGPALACVW